MYLHTLSSCPSSIACNSSTYSSLRQLLASYPPLFTSFHRFDPILVTLWPKDNEVAVISREKEEQFATRRLRTAADIWKSFSMQSQRYCTQNPRWRTCAMKWKVSTWRATPFVLLWPMYRLSVSPGVNWPPFTHLLRSSFHSGLVQHSSRCALRSRLQRRVRFLIRSVTMMPRNNASSAWPMRSQPYWRVSS
jgi:hypothetical protein